MGVSFVGALALIFIVLKLTGIIHATWLWLILPALAGIIIVGMVIFFLFVVLYIKS